VTISIDNAGTTQYARAWAYHRPYVCVDGDWSPIDAAPRYEAGVLTFTVPVAGSAVSVSWYPPYSTEMVDAFIDHTFGGRPYANIEHTRDGHLVLSLGNVRAPAIVLIARQHPGETIGSFVLEGFLKRLLADTDDTRRLLEQFRFLVMPVVNVSGVHHHLHRHDAQGRDINRSWKAEPEPPDITAVKSFLNKVPDVFAFFDIHGDEVSTVNFINYDVGRNVEKTRQRQYETLLRGLQSGEPKVLVWKSASFVKRFAKALLRQRKIIRPTAVTANAYVAIQHHTLALTVEPSVHLLTPAAAEELGASLVPALLAMNSESSSS
jgi:hypothetical protein